MERWQVTSYFACLIPVLLYALLRLGKAKVGIASLGSYWAQSGKKTCRVWEVPGRLPGGGRLQLKEKLRSFDEVQRADTRSLRWWKKCPATIGEWDESCAIWKVSELTKTKPGCQDQSAKEQGRRDVYKLPLWFFYFEFPLLKKLVNLVYVILKTVIFQFKSILIFFGKFTVGKGLVRSISKLMLILDPIVLTVNWKTVLEIWCKDKLPPTTQVALTTTTGLVYSVITNWNWEVNFPNVVLKRNNTGIINTLWIFI